MNLSIFYILNLPKDLRNTEQNNIIANYLQDGRFFSQINDIQTLQEIAKHLYFQSYGENQIIFKENTIGDAFYIIIRGRVIGYKESDPLQNEIFSLSENQCFGEMALLSDQPRLCSIKTAEPTDLIVVKKEIYNQYESVI